MCFRSSSRRWLLEAQPLVQGLEEHERAPRVVVGHERVHHDVPLHAGVDVVFFRVSVWCSSHTSMKRYIAMSNCMTMTYQRHMRSWVELRIAFPFFSLSSPPSPPAARARLGRATAAPNRHVHARRATRRTRRCNPQRARC